MKKTIAPNDCKTMFNDKFNALSMKDIGMELKHFSVGTAPESPSVLVNQDELKGKLIDKFTIFFDRERSQGLEIMFLKSNYGNGKSHFLRTIRAFLDNFENVLTKQVSLKQDKTNLKLKVLEAIGQKMIKDCATNFVEEAKENANSYDKDSIVLTLNETHEISSELAEVLFRAASDDEIPLQAKAISILKGNTNSEYLKAFNLKTRDINSNFYQDIIKLICKYLDNNNKYLVVVLDEYEHVYLWKDKQARNSFFEDIKYFSDYLETYKNLFFIFGESESSDSDSLSLIDPALLSRKKGLTYEISDVSSVKEINALYQMIKKRYEKYYEISLAEYESILLDEIKNDPNVKSNSNYREYTRTIMRVFDKYRVSPPKAHKLKKKTITHTNDLYNEIEQSRGEAILKDKWNSATSITRKSILFDAVVSILLKSNENIDNMSKRSGFIQTSTLEEKKGYFIYSTNNCSDADFEKRNIEAMQNSAVKNLDKYIVLYPYYENINGKNINENTIFYNVSTVPDTIEYFSTITLHIDNVTSYLKKLESR